MNAVYSFLLGGLIAIGSMILTVFLYIVLAIVICAGSFLEWLEELYCAFLQWIRSHENKD